MNEAPKPIPPDHHDWDKATNRCRKCGILESKAHSLVWGCLKDKTHANRRSLKRFRKPTEDE